MGAPQGPWGPQPWQQPWWPPPWGPPPALPPVVPARYVPGGRERPDGGGPPPRWPWVLVSVVAALVLVAGVVVSLVLATADPAPEAAGARPAAAAAEPLLYGAGKRPVRLDSIPAATRLEPSLTWDSAVTTGPDGAAATTALRFVQAVRALDWATAYSLAAPEVRTAARALARQLGTDPPTVVGAAFYGDELRGEAVAGGSLVGVEPYPGEFLVTFRLQLVDATAATVTLWLSRGYTVQDWT